MKQMILTGVAKTLGAIGLVFSTVYSLYVGLDLNGSITQQSIPAAESKICSTCPAVPEARSEQGTSHDPLPAEPAGDRAEIAPPDAGAASTTPYAESEIRAQLQPLQYTTMSAEIPGKIQRIHVQEGMTFKKGDPLIALDCARHKAELKKARAVLDAAQRIYAANRRLFELQSAGQIEVETSAAEAEKARAEVLVVSTTVSKCRIDAPFDGKVAEQKEREEEYVQAGQPILDILDDTTMELEFLVPSKWLTWLASGAQLTVHIEETDGLYPAFVKRIGAKADSVSRSVKITAVIAGEYPELAPGMSGTIVIAKPSR